MPFDILLITQIHTNCRTMPCLLLPHCNAVSTEREARIATGNFNMFDTSFINLKCNVLRLSNYFGSSALLPFLMSCNIPTKLKNIYILNNNVKITLRGLKKHHRVIKVEICSLQKASGPNIQLKICIVSS